MEGREVLTKAGKILYDILGVVLIICIILCMALCIYRNIVVLDGGEVPQTFIMEIIICIFSGIVVIKQYNFLDKTMVNIYIFLCKVVGFLNWVFAIIMISQIIIHILY